MIAPESVGSVTPIGAERQQTQTAAGGRHPLSQDHPRARKDIPTLQESLPDILPPLPPPPDPPGTAYVAAVLAGQLSPRPTSMEEVFLRVGKDWTPPESQFRLTDKSV